MTNPSDEAMKRAQSAGDAFWEARDKHKIPPPLLHFVALAIDKAVEEEREACAWIAEQPSAVGEEFMKVVPDPKNKPLVYESWVAGVCDHARMSASAIRTRKQEDDR